MRAWGLSEWFGYAGRMLLLFDIDGTLLRTYGLGIRAIEQAGRELFGVNFSLDGIETAGRLDPLIFADAMTRAGVGVTRERILQLRDAYARELIALLEAEPEATVAMPGVHDLLAALHEGARGRMADGTHLTLGVLTGNFALTGQAKMRACGIDPFQFQVNVWGDDSPHEPPAREHLVGVGIERSAGFRGGTSPAGREVVVIGDTPHDVACARSNGCRSLAVGTGSFSLEDLTAYGADWAVTDLSDTARVLSWIFEGQ